MAAKKSKRVVSDIEAQAINLVQGERAAWETATAFVTEKVAFQMRNLLRQCRKNYWGIFDQPIDSVTGKKKVWIPLTEIKVEEVVKNVDVDTKNIDIIAENSTTANFSRLVRGKVKCELDNINFGETLDELIRDIAINGTGVWKTIKTVDDNGLTGIKVRSVDLLNFYIDPTAHSIQEAPAVLERAVLTISELQSMNGWKNTEDVKPTDNISYSDGEMSKFGSGGGGTPSLVEVWERWGLIPEYLITGKKEDTKLVEGHIVVSDLGGNARVHLIERNRSGVKPYEECWYNRVSGRWYGRGVAEKLMMLQVWQNTIANIRILQTQLSSMGLFKIKKGRGITPQMLSRMATNGALEVTDIDDIEQFVIQQVSSAAYNEDASIENFAKSLTSTYEVAVGDSLPSRTSATAASIQATSAGTQFNLVKEGIGMFLERWIKRQVLPNLTLKKGDVVRIVGVDPQELREIDDDIAKYIMAEEYAEAKSMGNGDKYLEEVPVRKDVIIGELARGGNGRRLKMQEEVKLSEFYPIVNVANEKIDKPTLTSNLINVMQSAPEYRDEALKQLFDVMGLGFRKLSPNPMAQAGGAMQPQPAAPTM